jgi:hypothetical protein
MLIFIEKENTKNIEISKENAYIFSMGFIGRYQKYNFSSDTIYLSNKQFDVLEKIKDYRRKTFEDVKVYFIYANRVYDITQYRVVDYSKKHIEEMTLQEKRDARIESLLITKLYIESWSPGRIDSHFGSKDAVLIHQYMDNNKH